ncbi:spondin domain-containing protein [Salinimonas sediminis]|uniref:Uncharacterized protein n=1 Tax=Salinimonas sediminis TaxID=2303538 RepID=A0A346NIV3_9ALTE|nr:spondin domain-containing protein [Salinimonas sediminis]AXR05460.1 hypothetical protein D0Y50_03200 [Salinimonas sediminis]
MTSAAVSTTLQTATTYSRLSVVAMTLPTNDGFVVLNNRVIPTQAGQYMVYLNAYTVDTEANGDIRGRRGCWRSWYAVFPSLEGSAGVMS